MNAIDIESRREYAVSAIGEHRKYRADVGMPSAAAEIERRAAINENACRCCFNHPKPQSVLGNPQIIAARRILCVDRYRSCRELCAASAWPRLEAAAATLRQQEALISSLRMMSAKAVYFPIIPSVRVNIVRGKAMSSGENNAQHGHLYGS